MKGLNAAEIFSQEAGGHRWQRVPPNEKRGRVQTSTVTVATLLEPTPGTFELFSRDVEWQACRGSGAGGQARNKTSSAVQIRHLPTGLIVRCEAERSQHQNRETAMEILRAKLWASSQAKKDEELTNARRRQLGSGQRGDKRRTIRVQDGTVVDHVTGRRWRLREYLRGEW